jgi:hypothetical protein
MGGAVTGAALIGGAMTVTRARNADRRCDRRAVRRQPHEGLLVTLGILRH